ncbi:RNA polymerase sigma-70 factor [Bacteroides helcogenes]|uniref:RNA polymerase, sigma-24 subunit, ECF subfamily n=1 Tax=Bacteroides helcogenes (strain ATCC 35417 / DSM 20613 / JCM 6297 / CCUG 15421 / P 36-108) TaxID=693979 RepID=E6SRX5_BACT6|nr:RNA polymerase sigma-70 factor [Bacteroides helcogenes]ADV42134.1 RNA polymerase, sigma-24 subunit, ECF subfamily [Bacteroides helcogenes P 36-108]MDY5240081.1 RNA polymerase sigma-70 factor [Bacteroides helcogenes]
MEIGHNLDFLFARIVFQDDEVAFKKLFFDFFAPLCLFASRYIEEKEACEDVVQNVFFHLWHSRKHLQINASVRNFLLTSVRNACIDYLRKQKLEIRYRASLPMEETDDRDADTLLAMSELKERLEQALSRLPENVRHAFQLSRFEEKTYAAIAEDMGISIKTVEAYISKALKLLRVELKEFLPFLILFLDLSR